MIVERGWRRDRGLLVLVVGLRDRRKKGGMCACMHVAVNQHMERHTLHIPL